MWYSTVNQPFLSPCCHHSDEQLKSSWISVKVQSFQKSSAERSHSLPAATQECWPWDRNLPGPWGSANVHQLLVHCHDYAARPQKRCHLSPFLLRLQKTVVHSLVRVWLQWQRLRFRRDHFALVWWSEYFGTPQWVSRWAQEFHLWAWSKMYFVPGIHKSWSHLYCETQRFDPSMLGISCCVSLQILQPTTLSADVVLGLSPTRLRRTHCLRK